MKDREGEKRKEKQGRYWGLFIWLSSPISNLLTNELEVAKSVLGDMINTGWVNADDQR